MIIILGISQKGKIIVFIVIFQSSGNNFFLNRSFFGLNGFIKGPYFSFFQRSITLLTGSHKKGGKIVSPKNSAGSKRRKRRRMTCSFYLQKVFSSAFFQDGSHTKSRTKRTKMNFGRIIFGRYS